MFFCGSIRRQQLQELIPQSRAVVTRRVRECTSPCSRNGQCCLEQEFKSIQVVHREASVEWSSNGTRNRARYARALPVTQFAQAETSTSRAGRRIAPWDNIYQKSAYSAAVIPSTPNASALYTGSPTILKSLRLIPLA